jgi:nucleoside 2-deoxyribosyltransferase
MKLVQLLPITTMKIYFSCSIRGVRPEPGTAKKLIDHMKRHGTVLTEHIGEITDPDEIGQADTAIFRRDINWLEEADALVAEVTGPSIGVGYEIGIAETLGKPILCLFRVGRGRRLSAMVGGNDYLTVREYSTMTEAFSLIDGFLETSAG